MSADDLKQYRAVERAPVRGSYRGYDIVSMPPPSSGGVELIEMLNILEGYDLAHDDPAQQAFLMVEAMKRAYADRAFYLGDPSTVDNPVTRLTAKNYAAQWRATIDPTHATPASMIHTGGSVGGEGRNTTHFSVVDRFGNAVSNTYTLNFSYGVGLVAEGTGILLNNELDDFAAKPGSPNAYGLVGFSANAPGPGKRPLSSMTPTIVLKDGKPFLITGSPGGSRIITAIVLTLVNVIDYGMTIQEAVDAPRFHQQWLPSATYLEPFALSPDTKKILEVTNLVTITAAALTVLLTIASILLIANTIRLSLYARRREVEVMKLVGATDWFIRWPFVIEGIVVGAAGALLAIAVLALAKVVLLDPLANNWTLIASPRTISFTALVIVLMGAGVLVSALGSGLSLRRFLRV